jgi:hypothetical protein
MAKSESKKSASTDVVVAKPTARQVAARKGAQTRAKNAIVARANTAKHGAYGKIGDRIIGGVACHDEPGSKELGNIASKLGKGMAEHMGMSPELAKMFGALARDLGRSNAGGRVVLGDNDAQVAVG